MKSLLSIVCIAILCSRATADPVKVSELPAAGALNGAEQVMVVQDGASRRTTAADLRLAGGSRIFRIHNECIRVGTNTENWAYTVLGDGSEWSIYANPPSLPVFDQWTIGVAVATAGGGDGRYASVLAAQSDTAPAAAMSVGQVHLFEARVRIPTASTAGNSFTVILGSFNQSGFPLGVWCSYTHSANSGRWECHTASGTGGPSSTTTVDSGVLVHFPAWKVFRISYDGASATYWIDGTQVASITTNLPASHVGYPLGGIRITHGDAGSDARSIQVDYLTLTSYLNR
jgi:hypothetical protein